jgi:hypothetical protein
MQEGRWETSRPPRTPSAIQDSATESAKQAIEGQTNETILTRSREDRPGSGEPDRASADIARGVNANMKTPCPGSLVVTSYLRCKPEMSGQDAMSWYTASLFSFGGCWSIAIFSSSACESGLSIGLFFLNASDIVAFSCESSRKKSQRNNNRDE